MQLSLGTLYHLNEVSSYLVTFSNAVYFVLSLLSDVISITWSLADKSFVQALDSV